MTEQPVVEEYSTAPTPDYQPGHLVKKGAFPRYAMIVSAPLVAGVYFAAGVVLAREEGPGPAIDEFYVEVEGMGGLIVPTMMRAYREIELGEVVGYADAHALDLTRCVYLAALGGRPL